VTASFIEGKAFWCGDHVNTDNMAPGRFEPYRSDDHLASCALIDYESPVPFVDPATGKSEFAVIIAGFNFGCGSRRETAPQALRYAGARVVIARSFARIFFRNCVNMGLILPIQCDHTLDDSVLGKHVTVDTVNRVFTALGERFEFAEFGPLEAIIAAGGLTAYTKARIQGGLL
jgi:3-isopropylmalate/(R)-2-methylmalate dehydratase small subunit